VHANFLSKLADDGCPLVVVDLFLTKAGPDAAADRALAASIHRLTNVVLAARATQIDDDHAFGRMIESPLHLFLSANHDNWGVGVLNTNSHGVPMKVPEYVQGSNPSVALAAAVMEGYDPGKATGEKWIQYYGPHGTLPHISYQAATNAVPGFFHNKIVFIGNKPESAVPGGSESDKFNTPFNDATGGVEILATAYLNLIHHDWLRRPGKTSEACLIILAGFMLGGGLWHLKKTMAVVAALLALVAVTAVAVSLYYYANLWFPWCIIAGAQLPCALVWAMAAKPVSVPETKTRVMPRPVPDKNKTMRVPIPEAAVPVVPGYQLASRPFGEGGFGQVWLARNVLGQWQVVKFVFPRNAHDPKAYEAELNGLRRFKPVSEGHPGLLRIEFVSEPNANGFYYIMERGDALTPDWENNPALYKPKDLDSLRKKSEDGRLPVKECMTIIIKLVEALGYLHDQKLIHRDIKPSNVIFVKGVPKLADVGLVSDERKPEEIRTMIGTPGYMPPGNEPPGTVQADIYAMGMLMYVISTGNKPKLFPELCTSLMENSHRLEFQHLNRIITRACDPDLGRRYQNTAELMADLHQAAEAIGA
jgi:hypothetical protein